MIKILIIGSGGREHAIGWKLSQNDDVSTIFYAPGNGGTAENKGVNIPIEIAYNNFEKIYKFILYKKIDMAVIGPEGPLTDQKASLLESDKFL